MASYMCLIIGNKCMYICMYISTFLYVHEYYAYIVLELCSDTTFFAQRVACLLRKVVLEIERRISTQADHLRTVTCLMDFVTSNGFLFATPC
jgi:hypothetical protein